MKMPLSKSERQAIARVMLDALEVCWPEHDGRTQAIAFVKNASRSLVRDDKAMRNLWILVHHHAKAALGEPNGDLGYMTGQREGLENLKETLRLASKGVELP